MRKLALLLVLILLGCSGRKGVNEAVKVRTALQKHLDAISARDLRSLKATLAPNDSIELILPGSPITYLSKDFIEMHEGWFAESNWTFTPEIISIKQIGALAFATVLVDYREDERNGKPYYNRMHVSYVLENIEDQWYVIKDHACSFEKSSD